MARIIRNGPGKFELMEALFSEGGHSLTVTFELEVPEVGSKEALAMPRGHAHMDAHGGNGGIPGCSVELRIFVDSVGKHPKREHPSVWDFTGHTVCDENHDKYYLVKGVFSTKNRKGAIMYAEE